MARTDGDVELRMKSLVPAGVIVVEANAAWMWHEGLLPDEATAINRGVAEKRRREFTAGRNCARQALAILGLSGVSIPVGSRGQPIWPPGFVGSITHCAGYCAAAVGRREQFASIGIDAELHIKLQADVEELVCTQEEQRWIGSMPRSCGIYWSTVIFSAKESLYKAWYPLTCYWLSFDEAELTISPDRGKFSAQISSLPQDLMPDLIFFDGRFVVAEDYVFTAVAVPTNTVATNP